MKLKQISFFPPAKIEYGGDSSKGKRKIQRPFDPKRPLHITLRSSSARGERSLLRPVNKWRVHQLLYKTSRRYQIKVYRYANVGNHLHLLVKAKSRHDFQGFLREFSGVVASMMTGAVKGSPRKFWDAPAWTKIVEWGRQFKNVASYILLNVLESSGLRDRELLARLQGDGLIMVLEPG